MVESIWGKALANRCDIQSGAIISVIFFCLS
jgi:hypothetical protein